MYRRRIEIACDHDSISTAWMEDDFHHFGVEVTHGGGIIRDVRVASPRAPFSACPGAAARLRPLIGRALVARASDIGGLIDMRAQCTHMFDLAGLAVAAAAARVRHRHYDVTVTDRYPRPSPRHPHTGNCVAVLWRDGARILHWTMQDQAIIVPEPPRSLTQGFRAWTESLPIDDAEAALVLRRAVGVAAGRVVDLDGAAFASDIGLPPLCYTYAPDQAPTARRNVGTRRIFTAGARPLAASDSMVFPQHPGPH